MKIRGKSCSKMWVTGVRIWPNLNYKEIVCNDVKYYQQKVADSYYSPGAVAQSNLLIRLWKMLSHQFSCQSVTDVVILSLCPCMCVFFTIVLLPFIFPNLKSSHYPNSHSLYIFLFFSLISRLPFLHETIF